MPVRLTPHCSSINNCDKYSRWKMGGVMLLSEYFPLNWVSSLTVHIISNNSFPLPDSLQGKIERFDNFLQMWISLVIWNSLWRNRISHFFQLNASQHVTRADNVGSAEMAKHLLLEKRLSVPLFPLDPPPSLYPLFWGWLSLCVKLYRGVITAPLEKGGCSTRKLGDVAA